MNDAELMLIRAGALLPWPDLNPRRHFDQAKHDELVASIKRSGLHQPLVVHRTHPGQPRELHVFWVIAGERRLRAAQAIGPDTLVPCMVREYSEDEALEVALIENMDRDDLTPVEEARGFKRLLELRDMTQKKLAERVGRTQPYVSNRIRLLELPDGILEAVERGQIEMSHARDMLVPFTKLRDDTKREQLFKEVLADLGNERIGADLDGVVAAVAAQMSRPISAKDCSYRETEPEFHARAHSNCTCGGPKFQYGYGAAYVRCFDAEWWDAAQAKAVEKRKAAEKKAREAVERGAGAETATLITESQFHKDYDTNVHQASISEQLAEASVLADAPLVVVKPNWSGGTFVVCCTDKKLLRRARSAVKKEERRLVAERRATRAAEDRAEAAKLGVEPWMLAQMLVGRPMRDTVLDVGRDLGLEIGKHGEVDEHLAKLPAADIELLFKVLAMRCKRGDLGWEDPIAKEVRAQLTKKFTPGVNALVKKARKAADRNSTKAAAA